MVTAQEFQTLSLFWNVSVYTQNSKCLSSIFFVDILIPGHVYITVTSLLISVRIYFHNYNNHENICVCCLGSWILLLNLKGKECACIAKDTELTASFLNMLDLSSVKHIPV